MTSSLLEFSKSSLQLQTDAKKVLKQLKQKELSVQELSQVMRFLEQTHLNPKEVLKLITLAKKYTLSTQVLERRYTAYKTKEKIIPLLKSKLKDLGLKNIKILPSVISAQGKYNTSLSIHIRQPLIVNLFPTTVQDPESFAHYTQDISKKLKQVLK